MLLYRLEFFRSGGREAFQDRLHCQDDQKRQRKHQQQPALEAGILLGILKFAQTVSVSKKYLEIAMTQFTRCSAEVRPPFRTTGS